MKAILLPDINHSQEIVTRRLHPTCLQRNTHEKGHTITIQRNMSRKKVEGECPVTYDPCTHAMSITTGDPQNGVELKK